MRFREFDKWESFQDIDWEIIENKLVECGEKALRKFCRQQRGDRAYGVVFQVGQNWDFSIHVGTEGTFKAYVEGGKKKAQEALGKWHIDDWKWNCIAYHFKVPSPDIEHNALLEGMFLADLEADDEGGEAWDLFREFKETTGRAAAKLTISEPAQLLERTSDFRFRYIYDYEWEDQLLKRLQRKAEKGNLPIQRRKRRGGMCRAS